MCVHICACDVCLWKSEVDVMNLPHHSLALFVKVGFLDQTGSSKRLVSLASLPWVLPCLHLALEADVQAQHHLCVLGVLTGSEFQSSCLHSWSFNW